MVNCKRFVNCRFSSNTYILWHPSFENVWVVDPGDTDNVFEWMKNHSKTVITGILLTHAHFDHIYGMNEILSRYPQCVVYVANDYGVETLKDAKKNGSKYTEEGPIVIRDETIVKYYSESMKLWDDVLAIVLYTPGHSDDSVCFIVEGMLFTGDTLIKGVRTVTKLKGGSVEKLEKTIGYIETLKGNCLKILPGHDESFDLDDYDLTIATKKTI